MDRDLQTAINQRFGEQRMTAADLHKATVDVLRSKATGAEKLELIRIIQSIDPTNDRVPAPAPAAPVAYVPPVPLEMKPTWADKISNFDDSTVHQQLKLPRAIMDRLYNHQKVGVNWMYHLYRSKMGGLLGDDMGMGKTFQVISLLVGLMRQHLVSRILILAPVTVLPAWQHELVDLLQPHISSAQIHLINSDVPKRRREVILADAFESMDPFVVISSHQMVSTMTDAYCAGEWDYVILDEGHVIKNIKTALSKAVHQLKSAHRLLLTGTPIQNNLAEFWAIIDWATSGRCLGSLSDFKQDIAEPILKGQDPRTHMFHQKEAAAAMKLLVKLVRPVLLQRKKKDYLTVGCKPEPGRVLIQLPEKKEFVVWITLSAQQKAKYREFLDSTDVRNALRQDKFAIQIIVILKVLCTHPFLWDFADVKKEIAASIQQQEDHDEGEQMKAVKSIHDLPQEMLDVDVLMEGSVKLRILVHMVTVLVGNGHRVLVFSQSKIMQQVIQHVLQQIAHCASVRIDGDTCYKDRQKIIEAFNAPKPTGPSVCLLTTKACGFGITLTGADRVIIFDPSWNPAEDNQAVDRAYRIGQRKPVLVYRFIHSGCVEQKIYQKQVFKEGLREVSEKGTETNKRYCAGETHLQELVCLDNERPSFGSAAGDSRCNIFAQLKSDMNYLQEDGFFLHDATELPGVVGVTRHDQLYLAEGAAQPVKKAPVLPNALESGGEDESVSIDLEDSSSSSSDSHGKRRYKGGIVDLMSPANCKKAKRGPVFVDLMDSDGDGADDFDEDDKDNASAAYNEDEAFTAALEASMVSWDESCGGIVDFIDNDDECSSSSSSSSSSMKRPSESTQNVIDLSGMDDEGVHEVESSPLRMFQREDVQNLFELMRSAEKQLAASDERRVLGDITNTNRAVSAGQDGQLCARKGVLELGNSSLGTCAELDFCE